jgi:MoaA/NifB/PqqE/SkfB family radical SAM enzyme
MKLPITIVPANKDYTFITWEVFNICNYSCSYCPEELHSGSFNAIELDDALYFFNEVFLDHDHDSERRILSIGGGEPTLWKNLKSFINRLDDSYSIELVTNGSRTIRWWDEFINNVKLDRIVISVHMEYAKVPHIIELIELLNCRTQLTVMILTTDQSQFGEVCHIYDHIKNSSSLKCSFRVKAIVDKKHGSYLSSNNEHIETMVINSNYGDMKYSNDIIMNEQYLNINQVNSMISKNQNRFKDYKCFIGNKRIYITYDGSIYGASCSTAKLYRMGNIRDDVIKKFISPVRCRNEYCPCPPDIRIHKTNE